MGTVEYDSSTEWHGNLDGGHAGTGRFSGVPWRGASERERDTGGEAWGQSWPSNEHALHMRRSVQRGWRRLGFRRQFVILLVAATLLSTLGTIVAGYVGARAIVLNTVQAQVGRELRVAGQALAAHGKAVAQRDGQLFTEDGYRLNGDSTLMGQITALTGDDAAVYQVQGTQLVGVAGNLGVGGAVLGDALSGAPYHALLGGCLSSQPPASCQHGYQGMVTLHGASYVAAFMPLSDASGTPTGALEVASPLASIEAPLRLLAGVLLLIGLGLAAVFTVMAYRISGPVSSRAVATLSDGLDDVAGAAARLGKLARTQVVHVNRQTSTARHVMDELRALGDAAQALEHGVSLLRDAARRLWTETSSLGAAPAGGNGPQSARQIAVAVSQLGGAADQANALCQSLRAMMNQIIAEAGVLADNGREADLRVHELARSLERIEEVLGNRQTGFPFVGAWGTDEPLVLEPDRSTRRVAIFDQGAPGTGSVRAGGRGAYGEHGGLTGESRTLARETGGAVASPGMGSAGRFGAPGSMSGAGGARAAAAWPGSSSRSSGRHPAASRPMPGLQPETSQSAPLPRFRQGEGFPHATPHSAASGGPRSTGSHPSTTGWQRTPWFSDERDLTDALRQTGSMHTPKVPADAHPGGPRGADEERGMGGMGGRSGTWNTAQAGDGQPGGRRFPAPPPTPRPSPPPRSSDWMNDLR